MSLIPPALVGPRCTDPDGFPRYAATIWLDFLRAHQAVATREKHALSIGRLYRDAEAMNPSVDLDSALMTANIFDLERVLSSALIGHQAHGSDDKRWAVQKRFVFGFLATVCISDNTCPHCRHGFQSSCEQREFMSGAQASYARVPLADGTMVATETMPDDDLIPSLLAVSDVLGTGWYAADAARVQPGSTVAVVGDGAVGLMGVLAAKQMGAGRIIAMSRHKSRQDLALEYGATDIVSERGGDDVNRIKELTQGVGADSVLECVGTNESMHQAINCARPGGSIGFVGVPHGVELNGEFLFFAQKSLMGGPAPVRRFLPHLMDLVLTRKINPGKVFDLTLPIEDVAEGYRAMDERSAIKTLLRV